MTGYQHIWLTNNLKDSAALKKIGINAISPSSLYGIWIQLRTAYVVDDMNLDFVHPLLLKGALRIELWHGIPNKVIMNARKRKIDYSVQFKHRKNYKFLCTATSLNDMFSFAFKIDKDNILISNYPRNRMLLLPEEERKNFIKKYEEESMVKKYDEIHQLNGRKVIYMPTFREGNINYLNTAIPNWVEFNQFCMSHNIHFFLKVHRVSKIPNISEMSNVHILDSYMDVYPLLPLFDLLVTDYSSIMYDFPLTGKKVLLYTYDQDEYEKNSRSFFPHFEPLKRRLAVASNYNEMLAYLSADWGLIKEFPTDEFIEDKYNFDTIQKYIQKQLNKD